MTTTAEIMTRLQVINANVTGITSTSKYPPVSVSTAQLPLMYSRWDRNEYEYDRGMSRTFQQFELVVLVQAMAQSTYDAQMSDVATIADAIRDTYAARLLLNDDDDNGLTDIALALVESAQNGPPVQIGETFYSTVRATLRVKNLTAVTVDG